MTLHVVDPGSESAQSALRQYLAEIGERAGAVRDPEPALVDARTEYVPPLGVFVVDVDDGGAAQACGALRWLDAHRAEIKRMWVSPSHRGQGVGSRLLAFLEQLSRENGRRAVVLDTNGALVEAIALYERNGYERVERYNDNPHAQLWFAKTLR